MNRRALITGLTLALSSPAAAQGGDVFAVVRRGNLAALEAMLTSDPALLHKTDPSGATPLMVAAYTRDGIGFVRPEDNPAFVLIAARLPAPNLFEACLLNRSDLVRAAIAADPGQARAASQNGRTLLHYAAYAGDLEIIDALLDAGADIDAPAAGVFLSPPIVQAILGDRTAAVERLVARGARLDVRLDDGSTPLHEAAQLGRDEIVRILLRAGAAPAVRRSDGRTPAESALLRRHSQTARIIDAASR